MEKYFRRATEIAIDESRPNKENVGRALALGMMTMNALQEGGEPAAHALLMAAATARQHRLAGRDITNG